MQRLQQLCRTTAPCTHGPPFRPSATRRGNTCSAMPGHMWPVLAEAATEVCPARACQQRAWRQHLGLVRRPALQKGECTWGISTDSAQDPMRGRVCRVGNRRCFWELTASGLQASSPVAGRTSPCPLLALGFTLIVKLLSSLHSLLGCCLHCVRSCEHGLPVGRRATEAPVYTARGMPAKHDGLQLGPLTVYYTGVCPNGLSRQ